ncbi:hypothetical protein KF7HA_00131 [Lactococcus lactis]|nr:hypothetical protein [Lactococcus lactis]
MMLIQQQQQHTAEFPPQRNFTEMLILGFAWASWAGYDYNIVLGGGYGFIKGNTIMEVGDASNRTGGNTSGENVSKRR